MRRLLLLAAALTLLAACGDLDAVGEPDEPAATTTTTLPGIGDRVRDGSFEFVVHRVGTPLTDTDTPEPPLGVWVQLDLSVANVKDEPQTFLAADQRLIVDGAEYESAFSTDGVVSLNPGLGTDTSVLFDVPRSVLDADTAQVELHDSFLSGGVTVTVTPDWRRLSPTTTSAPATTAAQTATTLSDAETFEALMLIHPVLSGYAFEELYAAAEAVCYEFDYGAPWDEIAFVAFRDTPEDWDLDTVDYFMLTAVNALCPEHRGLMP